MGIIFDLDQTLVDSSIAYKARKNRNWSEVYSLINQFNSYEGIDEIIKLLKKNNIPMCVVTSSPESYCKKVLSKFGWSFMEKVCYHDTHKHKPNPEPILKGIEKLNCNKKDILSVGDDYNDIKAANASGVVSILSTWGRNCDIVEQGADYVCNTVEDLKKIIINKYNIILED